MVRWERIAALEEIEPALICRRALPAERVLERLRRNQTISYSLARENACLSLGLIMRNVTPDESAPRNSRKRSRTVIRKTPIAAQFVWIAREGMDEGAVGRDRDCGDRGKTKKPCAIVPVQVERTGPDGLLVESDILQQRKTYPALGEFRWFIPVFDAFVA